MHISVLNNIYDNVCFSSRDLTTEVRNLTTFALSWDDVIVRGFPSSFNNPEYKDICILTCLYVTLSSNLSLIRTHDLLLTSPLQVLCFCFTV